MSDPATAPLGRAAELARAFDRAFAEPARAFQDDADAVEDLLALRVGTTEYLVRLAEVRGLLVLPPVVSVPSPVPELMGLAGLRGALIPVYHLASLQGLAAPDAAPAWMILIEADGPVGLAFEELLGHVRLDRRDLAALPPAGGDGTGASAVPQTARVGNALRPLIDVPALVAGLRQRAGVVTTDRTVAAHRQE